MQKEICHGFQADWIQVPQKKCCRKFQLKHYWKMGWILQTTNINAASVSCRETSSMFFSNLVSKRCVKPCCTVNFVNSNQLLADLVRIMRITEFYVIYRSKLIHAPQMLKWILFLKYLVCFINYVLLQSHHKVLTKCGLLLHSHAQSLLKICTFA